MYDFKQHLESDEEIIYEGRPHPGKGEKSIGGLIFFSVFMLVIMIILILSVVFKIGDGENGINLSFIIIFLVCFWMFSIFIYNIIYTLFLKQRLVADDFYCITNKRVMKYEQNKDKLVYGYLECYKIMLCENMKQGYGDLIFSKEVEENNDDDAKEALTSFFKCDSCDMFQVIFESIERPRRVKKIAEEARNKLINKN